MGLLLGAFVSLVVLALVLLATDVNMNHTRRIEAQVARDRARVRTKSMRGWTVDRIARRYPHIPREHIIFVRRELARGIAAVEEVDYLESLWSLSSGEPG